MEITKFLDNVTYRHEGFPFFQIHLHNKKERQQTAMYTHTNGRTVSRQNRDKLGLIFGCI